MPCRILLAAALIVIPTSVLAKTSDLRPLSEYLLLPEGRKDAAYPLLRCIGLFQGLFRYGGANFSDEETLRTQLSTESMGLVALLVRQAKHPKIDINDLATQIGIEIENITVTYEERMKNNYTLTGEAWGADVVILDDFETCAPFAQYAVDKAGELSAR